MSRLVPIDQIAEGMELEQAVKNQYGQLLLPVSTKIEERHKKILKTWGINSIYIKEEFDDKAETQTTGNHRTEELKLLYDRFQWNPRNHNEEDLFEMVFYMTAASNKKSRGGI